MNEIYAGLMSGTSLDGVDGVIADFSAQPPAVLAHQHVPYPLALREELDALTLGCNDEIHRSQLAAQCLARLYSDCTHGLLSSASLRPEQIGAIGCHGQTLRHRPEAGYSLQLNAPALLAELTQIPVAADFRSRDIAAGGQGAPLVPAFHSIMFRRHGHDGAVLNIGGMANLSLLHADGGFKGFDTGPGNVLLDAWCQLKRGEAYDRGGAWAASGQPIPSLLNRLLAHDYFDRPPPKSCGREQFSLGWLRSQLLECDADADAADIQATLTALTAESVVRGLSAQRSGANELLVCGGGAFNIQLMLELQRRLPQMRVCSTTEAGMDPLHVEALAFAWLARQLCRGEPSNHPGATGAAGARVLGCLYPA